MSGSVYPSPTAAVVDLTSFVVVNVIVADAQTDPAPSGCELIDITNNANCGIGWTYNPTSQTFSPPS